MPIPPVAAEALRDAMGRFDQDQRGRSDWTGWEKNRTHRYAIEHDGRRYPVKQIVSMATGMPVSEFSGGQAAGDANQYVASRGFGMVELRRRNPDWMRDELILALDMYLRHGGNVDDPDTQFYENYSPRTPNPEPCFVCAKQIGSGSQQTLSWRKADSNHRSRSYERVRLVSPNRNDQLAPRITLRSSRGTAMAARPLGGRSVHGGTNGSNSLFLQRRVSCGPSAVSPPEPDGIGAAGLRASSRLLSSLKHVRD